MITCQKTFSDIPIAHRQHLHEGHCALVHGHNWTFVLTFGCEHPEVNGFVVDFGKLKFVRTWIEQNLDHACLFNWDDPLREQILAACPTVYRPYVLPSCSCEGLAEHLYMVFAPMVRNQTANRAYLLSVEVREDSKNSATYRPAKPT